jgi:hypothetical protein
LVTRQRRRRSEKGFRPREPGGRAAATGPGGTGAALLLTRGTSTTPRRRAKAESVSSTTSTTAAGRTAGNCQCLEGSRIGAGAPRYSLLFDDDSYLFPSALYCQETLPNDTVRSDFMSTTNCFVYGFTASTGFVAKTWSEWGDVFDDAQIEWVGLVIDEAGEYQLTNVVARPG